MRDALDPFMPTFDVRERFESRVRASPDAVMRTAYDIDMQSISIIRMIITAGKFILGGTREKREPKGLVEECLDIGWGKLAEEPQKLLVCGAVCQPWFGDVKFTSIPTDEFAAYNLTDHVKIVWSLETEEIKSGLTLFSHEVRALATDDEARRKFLRYWRWAKYGIVAIRYLLLPAIKREAERTASGLNRKKDFSQ